MSALVVTDWIAQRSGSGITIRGKSLDGFSVRITDAEIISADPHPIARGVSGGSRVKATLRP